MNNTRKKKLIIFCLGLISICAIVIIVSQNNGDDYKWDIEWTPRQIRDITTNGVLTINGKLFILDLGFFNDYQGYDVRIVEDINEYTVADGRKNKSTFDPITGNFAQKGDIRFYVAPTADLQSYSIIYTTPIKTSYFLGFNYYGVYIDSDKMLIYSKGVDWGKAMNSESTIQLLNEFSKTKNPGYYPPAWITNFRLTPKALTRLESLLEMLRMAKELKGDWNITHGKNNVESYVSIDRNESVYMSEINRNILWSSFMNTGISKSEMNDYLLNRYKKSGEGAIVDN